MKLSLKILKWIFLSYGILLPLALFFVPSLRGEQGIPYLLTPLIILLFLALLLWVYFLLKYSSKKEGEIEKRAIILIKVQINWLYLTVVFPLTFTIVREIISYWVEIPDVIVGFTSSYWMFMLYTKPISFFVAIASIIYYGRKSS
jgi:hypothetical protein